MVKVKICGITSLRDAWAALDAGADALGFNFHHASPRKVSTGEARAIIRTLPPFVASVAVFAEEAAGEMRKAAAACGAAFIQSPLLHGLHGDVAKIVRFPGRNLTIFATSPSWVPVVRVRGRADLVRVQRLDAPLIMLDSHDAKVAGGSGKSFSWSLLRRARPSAPFLLAGGLTPANVRRAIRTTRPYGVDVCSGVERTPGTKDHAKMRRFIRAAKTA